jgi:isopentenyl diphosphate isomerase/L-lactate dehydrogenase-like FMN-dependent dehydrogenase
VNIDDLRRLARRRLPRVVFDYIDGGADSEVTLRANCSAFDEVVLRPRSAVALPSCDLRVRVLGAELALPFLLAPVGSSRLFWPLGEAVAARAAGDAWALLVPGLSVRRPRCGIGGHRACARGRVHRARGDDRHAGRRPPGA